ncbi:hypothetical protein BC938DRAFT_478399 [Jimgerdemannia flammicorona]|uniref:Uncharacterized protein n=1 Tax=Jimgerdemannia flammicorona TaxID=994334 RepID=A0A433P5I8_9FUNG|nr:hypothetical protein BC938DRAFT_478399 [Jimgerdemannia flammicorona]
MNTIAIFSRSALRSRAIAPRQLLRSDLYHFENTRGQVRALRQTLAQMCINSIHHFLTLRNIPFSTKNKFGLAAGMLVYLGIGFSVPFLGMFCISQSEGNFGLFNVCSSGLR